MTKQLKDYCIFMFMYTAFMALVVVVTVSVYQGRINVGKRVCVRSHFEEYSDFEMPTTMRLGAFNVPLEDGTITKKKREICDEWQIKEQVK